MRTVHHPVFADVSFEVADDVERDWKAAGWRFTPIPASKVEIPAEPETDSSPAVDSE